MKKIAIVVPALEKNRYSEKGDLVDFGEMSLLEWKINQLKSLEEIANIYITTPSNSIIEKFENNVKIIKRKEGLHFSEVVSETMDNIDEEIVLWTNCTSPFISEKIYQDIIKEYRNIDKKKYDSIVSVVKMKEYFIFENKALNYDIKKYTAREELEEVYKITNGIFIADKRVYKEYKKTYGKNPFLYEIDKFSSHEIIDADDCIIANDLIALYFRKKYVELGE